MEDNFKKTILQRLISHAMGGASVGKGLHEVMNSIKTALGTYKNFAKEWDTLNGVVASGAGAKAGATVGSQVRAQPAMPPRPPQAPNLQTVSPMGARPTGMPTPTGAPTSMPPRPPIQPPQPGSMGQGQPPRF
jgi:hypothetical protein